MVIFLDFNVVKDMVIIKKKKRQREVVVVHYFKSQDVARALVRVYFFFKITKRKTTITSTRRQIKDRLH